MLNLRTVQATRYVTPLREGGSMPGLMEADDLGTYVVKFRGAGQGVRTLIAELITGEIGRVLGLPVPELVFFELDPAMAKAEPDPEIQQLLAASGGLNIAMDFLPGSLPWSVAMVPLVSPDLAARIVWLDALTTNIDRTARNPNLLIWHKQLWLIDHGASLYLQHTWTDIDTRAATPFPQSKDHVLLPVAGAIPAVGAELRKLLGDDQLDAIVAMIPDDWLEDARPFANANDLRQAYRDLLAARLKAADTFEAVAEVARIELQS
ncbi:MAG TPA: hypothetical protein PK691_11970 [Thermomicrobiales bacterium]|nr:hypothetical protein [Thermomicrobiales bacterium]